MSKKAIDKEYLLRQLKNYEEDVISEEYVDVGLMSAFVEGVETSLNRKIEGVSINGTAATITDKQAAITIGTATTASAGLLSASDKSKLDNIDPSGATVVYTPEVSSGTKIGTIAINGIPQDVYVPTDTDTTYEVATSSTDGLMSSTDKDKLDGISDGATAVSVSQELSSGTKIGAITVDGSSTDLYAPNAVTESDISGMGFTKNAGTITGITMNGSTVGTSGVVDLGTVITAHQDISGKVDKNGTDSLMTAEEHAKLSGIAANAEVNVQSDWNQSDNTKDDYIKNKPTLGTAAAKDIPTTGNATTAQVVMGNDSRLTDSRNAADVSAWAKAATKPTYTASEVGAIATTAKGANNGVAELDSTGKVPSSQLPSYVDDVLEYSSSSAFPATGETGKIYIDTTTDKTYRWSGSTYTEISASLALGETSSTAYRGDRGKTAYDHAADSSRLTTATTSGLYKVAATKEGHIASLTAVTKADITGLGIPGSDTTYTFTDKNATLSWGATSTIATVGGTDIRVTMPANPDNDTKNTAGSTEKASTKMFLVAATTQAANPQTYSNAKCYVGTDNCLYSNNTKVLTAHQSVTDKAATLSWGSTSTVATIGSTNITVKMPSNPNTNTTYTFATGDNNGQIKVTPSGGSAQNVDVKGLGTAAYKASTDFAVSKELTNEDLNSVTEPGFYNAGGSNTCTNKPSGAGAFGLEVVHTAAGSYYYQILNPNGSTSFYRRVCNNGTWGSWTLDKYTDTTYTFTNKSATLAYGSTSTIATVGGTNITVTMPADSGNTKNTAGTTEKASTKLFLAGATEQSANPQTYSNAKVYIGTDNCLYSNNTKVLTAHQTVTDKASTLAYGSASTIATIGSTNITVTMPADSGNTKNTAGTTNKTGTKMFLVAGTEQSANPQTYSNSNCYIGTDNCLYSGGTKVLTAHQTVTDKAATLSYGGTSTIATIGSTNITVKMPADSGNTKNTAGSTDSASKLFLIGATEQSANPQTYSDDQVYTQSGTLTSNKISTKAMIALTGSGTAGSTASATPKFVPTKWTFNAGITVANGEVYLIKIPTAGGTYGVWLSLNNGTNYYPVAVSSGSGRFTTHYAANTVIAVTYESAGTCSCYAQAGSDAVSTVTGIFRVLNDYDANSTGYLPTSGGQVNNLVTLYREGTTANNYPAGLKFKVKDTTTGQTYDGGYLYAYQDHGSTTYGVNFVLCGGGGLFIGSGESPGSHYSAKGSTFSGEDTFITADGTVNIQGNANTIGNRVGFQVTTAGALVPIKADTATTNIGSIGTSSYYVKDAYFTNINGVAVGSSPKFTDTTYTFTNKAPTLSWGATSTVATVGGTNITVTMPANPNSDTKDSAGTSNKTGTKMFLVGGTSQAANITTYSNSNCYIGTDNCLYSGGTKVLTAHQTVTNKAPTLAWGATSTVAVVGSTNITLTMPANPNTNTDTKVTQSNTTTANWRKILLGSQNDANAGTAVTATTEQAFVNPSVEVQPSTGGIRFKRYNSMVTGTGTAASTASATPKYKPAKWTFNLGANPSDGDVITIKIPVAGHDYGVFVSTDNGTTYKPVAVTYGTDRLTTHYANGSKIQLIYDSGGTVNNVYAAAGADARSNVSGGCWRVVNFYNTNTDVRPSAYCDTAAGTAAKAASCSGFTLTANRHIHVIMVNANSSASAITLNINGKGAKPIYINGTASSASNYTLPAGSYLVYYNGTNFYFRTDGKLTMAGMVDTSNNNLNTWRGVQNNLTSTATDQSLSAAQGKILNEKITNWTATQTLAEGTTSVTFTGLTSTYAYDLYSETADGTPVYTTGYTVSGTSITYTLQAITSGQAGTGGTGCKVKLKCLY